MRLLSVHETVNFRTFSVGCRSTGRVERSESQSPAFENDATGDSTAAAQSDTDLLMTTEHANTDGELADEQIDADPAGDSEIVGGLEENVAGAVAYFLGPITGILFSSSRTQTSSFGFTPHRV